MVYYLIGMHAALGELGAIGFLWVLIELLNPSALRISRAKIVAVIATILIFLSWLSGGFYYVEYYGPVKAIIKEGPQPWAHLVFTETKEHIFLFLPFISILTTAMLIKYEKAILKNKNIRHSIMALSLAIFLLAVLVGVMGYLISTGARIALEALQ